MHQYRPLSVWNRPRARATLPRSTATWRSRRLYREPHLPRVLPLRRPWPTSPPTGSTRALRPGGNRRSPATLATPTTSSSPAANPSRGRSPGSRPTLPRSRSRRDSTSSTARPSHATGVRQHAAGVVINQKINIQGVITTSSRRSCATASARPPKPEPRHVADFRAPWLAGLPMPPAQPRARQPRCGCSSGLSGEAERRTLFP